MKKRIILFLMLLAAMFCMSGCEVSLTPITRISDHFVTPVKRYDYAEIKNVYEKEKDLFMDVSEILFNRDGYWKEVHEKYYYEHQFTFDDELINKYFTPEEYNTIWMFFDKLRPTEIRFDNGNERNDPVSCLKFFFGKRKPNKKEHPSFDFIFFSIIDDSRPTEINQAKEYYFSRDLVREPIVDDKIYVCY